MTNIIEGMNVLEQTPIKDYTILSNTFVWGGIGIAIIATIIFFIKIKNKNVLHWERGYAYFSTGKEKLWVPFKLIKMRHVKGRPPEYLGYGEGKGD